jgi:hypothetical protein
MSRYIQPSIGSSGVIKLKYPFTGLCSAGVPYEVTGLQTLHAVASTNQDPYALFYEPFEIDREKFAADVADRVCIVTLRASDGEEVKVPNSYLESLPVATGVPYGTMLVTVNLGALPQDLSLQYFMSQLKDMARDLMGVQNAAVRAMLASSLTSLTVEDAAAIESAREVVMGAVVTDAAKLRVAQEALVALRAKYNDLEAYVLAQDNPIREP